MGKNLTGVPNFKYDRVVAFFKILLSQQYNRNEKNIVVEWKELKDGGVFVSYRIKDSKGERKI